MDPVERVKEVLDEEKPESGLVLWWDGEGREDAHSHRSLGDYYHLHELDVMCSRTAGRVSRCTAAYMAAYKGDHRSVSGRSRFPGCCCNSADRTSAQDHRWKDGLEIREFIAEIVFPVIENSNQWRTDVSVPFKAQLNIEWSEGSV